MLLIPCPHCGPRDQSEFDYGGGAVRLPDVSDPSADWHLAVHLRAHPSGQQPELWYHTAGCERWFTVRRDVKTHAFAAEEKA